MPDISDLKPSVMGAFMVASLGGLDKGKTKEEIRCLSLMARLIDKARYEYLIARETVLEEISEGKLSYDEIMKRDQGQFLYFPTIINHLENCINSLSRVYKLHKLLAPSHQFLLNQGQGVNKFRNHIEHMDERISRSLSGSHSLNISEDAAAIEIMGEVLQLQDIAEEIRWLYQKTREVLEK